MTTQTNANVRVVFAQEVSTTPGVPALVGAADANEMRITASPGAELKRANIKSVELRKDGQETMGRLGYKTLGASYSGEISVGGALDVFYQAIQRSTWTAAVPITVDGT